MKTWFDEPEELLNIEKVSEFWPTGEQTPEDRVNATSRFVIYKHVFFTSPAVTQEYLS